MYRVRTAAPILTLGLFGFVAGTSAEVKLGSPQPSATRRVEFNRDIRPILSSRCFACHGPDANQRKAGLRLDTLSGAKTGRAVVPGKPEQSQLVVRITANGDLQMPPPSTGKVLTASEIGLLRRWIAQGAEYQAHWSYLPPRRPALPAVRNAAWCRNPIDRFILARIESAGLKPSPDADPATLIRRLSFDLTGLPPTHEEVDAFVRESTAQRSKVGKIAASAAPPPSPNSQLPSPYEKVVDRLLASPHFGERMAIYWLDLVRYADTVGYHGDQEQHISAYRDWVIKAFNDDLPFDRFTAEQLAGDLLLDEELRKQGQEASLSSASAERLAPELRQRLIPTGYNRVLQTTHEGGAQDREYRAKYAADRVRNLGAVWMGATTGCTECHDHKYDPYTQKDFYSLAAFFADIDERGAYKGPDVTPTLRPPELEVLSPFDQEEASRLRAQLTALKERSGGEAPIAEMNALQARLDELQRHKQPTLVTLSVPPRPMRVLRRGDWMDEGGELVQPAVPHFLPDLGLATAGKARRLTRLDLARWLTSPEHPQTSRVFVNRAWYLLFGAGLCRSLEDAGSQGEWPTHPELLDWLASAFSSVPSSEFRVPDSPSAKGSAEPETRSPDQNRAWSVKRLVRLIVTSAAYRQSSVPTPDLLKRDPENRLFARQGRFRLPAEMIRDQALAVSGLLNPRIGGVSARPYQPEAYYSLLNFPRRTYQTDRDDSQYRRGVYVHWQRQYLHPMLRAFDAPSREECTAQRPVTNTPLAALTLLNDPSFVEAARALAARTMREGGDTPAQRIRWAWQLTLSRMPAEREVAALERLYRRSREQYQADPEAARQLMSVGMAPVPKDLDVAELAAWTAVARALFNVSETITRN